MALTATERYAKCETLAELDQEYHMNERSADSWEYLEACRKAYKKRRAELLKAGGNECIGRNY